jgi:hypothetical protein
VATNAAAIVVIGALFFISRLPPFLSQHVPEKSSQTTVKSRKYGCPVATPVQTRLGLVYGDQ